MPMNPEIDTERLTMRLPRREDFAEVALMWAMPEVTRFIGGKPLSQEDVWAKFLKTAGHWELLGFGYWILREKGSGLFVGEAGFGDFKRELEPSFAGAPEMGWALLPSQQGKGLATEALRAALVWQEENRPAPRVVAMIDDKNVRSVRLAEKFNFREYVRTTYKGTPAVLFERK